MLVVVLKCPPTQSKPGLARDEDLAGVHDAARQARRVDGAQGRTELHNVGPDQRLGQQAGVLPRRGRLVLPCTKQNIHTQKKQKQIVLSHQHSL